MNALTIVRTLGPIDLRAVRRDSYLAWAAFLPLALGALLRWGLPWVTSWIADAYAFDLTPWHPLIVSWFLVAIVPQLIGQVVGFLLLDERDDDTLRAWLVTPMPLGGYLAYRVGLPLLLAMGVAPLAVSGFGLVAIEWQRFAPIALLFALETPIMALAMASLCENKVQGFAFVKGVGAVPLLSAAAFFVDPPWQWLAGALPTYWPMRAFWTASTGGDGFWPAIAIGLALHVALLAWLLRVFRNRVHA